MKLLRTTLLAATLAVTGAAGAQDFPERGRTLTIINPYPPGGLGDVLARAVAQRMTESLGTPVIVENKPGANGSLGTTLTARAKPHGYTIAGVPMSTLAINPTIYPNLGYNPAKDLQPITIAITFANVLIATNSVPVTKLADLPAYLRENAAKLNYASQGNGSSGHLEGALLGLSTGADLTHVPFQGSAPAQQNVVAGEVQFLFENVPSALPLIQAGRVKALGVASEKPVDQLPGIPPIASVIKDFQATNWIAFIGPAGIPPHIVAKLNEHMRAALNHPDVRKVIEPRAATVVGSSPEELAKLIVTDTAKWADVIKRAKISVN